MELVSLLFFPVEHFGSDHVPFTRSRIFEFPFPGVSIVLILFRLDRKFYAAYDDVSSVHLRIRKVGFSRFIYRYKSEIILFKIA